MAGVAGSFSLLFLKAGVVMGRILLIEFTDDDDLEFEEIITFLNRYSHFEKFSLQDGAVISFPGLEICPERNLQESVQAVREQREPVVFEDMYPHAIRHTFCSRCFEADMQPKVVQSIMGHQHYSTTIDIYTHFTDAKFEEEIDKFGLALGEEPTEEAEEMEEGEGAGFGIMM